MNKEGNITFILLQQTKKIKIFKTNYIRLSDNVFRLFPSKQERNG